MFNIFVVLLLIESNSDCKWYSVVCNVNVDAEWWLGCVVRIVMSLVLPSSILVCNIVRDG